MSKASTRAPSSRNGVASTTTPVKIVTPSCARAIACENYSPTPFCPFVLMAIARVVPPLASTTFGVSVM